MHGIYSFSVVANHIMLTNTLVSTVLTVDGQKCMHDGEQKGWRLSRQPEAHTP